MPGTLTQARTVLAVPRLDRSVAFYREVMGLALDWQEAGWALLSRDGFELMLGECPDALPARDIGDHAYVAYLVVESVDALFAEFSARGVDVIKPLASEAWDMREFGIQTLDGHRLMFGEPCGEGDAAPG
ncbi:MAG TPA: VOC family protein [Burkholderiaceae bacterium]|nr:VOC family protein [Burkholderiaceae bacterium]